MNDNELFEEQIERTEQLPEERSNPAEDVNEELDSRKENDTKSELIEASAQELAQLPQVTKQCIYVSLEHLKPFSGTLYDEKAISALSPEIHSSFLTTILKRTIIVMTRAMIKLSLRPTLKAATRTTLKSSQSGGFMQVSNRKVY